MPLDSLLCLDVGGGTQDVLFWRADEPIENALKMVLPAPTQAVAKRIARATAQGRDICLHGRLMGGGAMARATAGHLAAGLQVYATAQSAASLHDNPQRVAAMGVTLVDQPPASALVIQTGDLDLAGLTTLCQTFEIDQPRRLAVALCDHGHSPGQSNRKFRFGLWRRFLASGGRLVELITHRPPAHLTRLAAAVAQWPGCLVMDTAAAAVWGALQDPAAAALAKQGLCVVNIGNEHTVAFIVGGERVWAVYEHHTGVLDQAMLADHIARFCQGALTDDEVFAGMGHGCARDDHAPAGDHLPVVITGPQRRLAQGLGWPVAAPHGDVMLAGCFGLMAAALAWDRGQA